MTPAGTSAGAVAAKSSPEVVTESPDYRLLAPAAGAWASAATAVGYAPTRALAAGAALVLLGLLTSRSGRHGWALVLLAAAAAALVAGLRVTANGAGPVPALAMDRAVVRAQLVLTTDPALQRGRFGDVVIAEARLEQVVGRGTSFDVDSPVLILADPDWTQLSLGTRVSAVGALSPSSDSDLSAVFAPSRIESILDRPVWWWRASAVMRDGVVEGVAGAGSDSRALVPALVDGDDSGISDELAEAFRTCGLTHLLAVSGTNLTLVVGFLLLIARWCGVRGYAQVAVGLLGTTGFVLLARPEPSVLRAAAMGLVALAGLGAGGRRRGVRALSLAVLCLVLVDPWLSRSIGFVLSVVATGGILVLAPSWSSALSRWLPLPLAEALAVPLAAQVACTPVVASLSGQVSMVAVAANVLAGPAVGPATVLGLAAGGLSLLWQGAGHLIGHLAGAMAWWIITIARHGAALPGASVGWGSGFAAIGALAALCLAFCLIAPRALAAVRTSLLCVALIAVWVLHPFTPGWPPSGWVMVACDVGQGDALVLNAGDGSVVVVDTGPEPRLVDRCLDRLDVERVALVVLTHLHADHSDGLAGVLDGRSVGQVEIGPVVPDGAQYAEVRRTAAADAVPVVAAAYATSRHVGALAWDVLGPAPGVASTDESGTAQNNSSIVLLVHTNGIRLLLTGDVEPEAQAALLPWGQLLHADVLKVPHHGSRFQDPRFLEAVGARVALISVGADNDYGHPSVDTVEILEDNGARVMRTDRDGDVALVVRDGQLSVTTQ